MSKLIVFNFELLRRVVDSRSPQLVLCFAVVAWSHLASADEPAGRSKPTALLKTFTDELVSITPGQGKFPKSFRMGSEDGKPAERPVHEVTFSKPFAIGCYEVPQNLYEIVMGENPSRWKGPRNSVEMMSWQDANTFCNRLTKLLRQEKLIADNELIRLPTEAEWEYCCRAGTESAYSFGAFATKPGDVGKTASVLDAYGWHTGNAAGNDPPVGALKPNPWGLYDMHGYLAEFVADDWHENYQNAPVDGTAWATKKPTKSAATRKVIRSGSWRDAYPELRSAARQAFGQNEKSDAVGFRCVKSTTRSNKN
ncbi:formylglycine-generating enzyme family protein [Thalassoroseus pseudoceratinae]|uniref:formylglycine-generating enzyme family protein n=1 Tax=Thalassoroseus pseudoceratinae TaxID=2713176 RepID=UPI0014216693|nr:formylglycine-generating enzyme family protein [Thalassoroseus pseudoceratinae]